MKKQFTLIFLSLFSIASIASAPIQNIIIFKELSFKLKKEKVWSALTDEKELSKWWNKGVRLEPKVGGEFYEPWGKDQLATGKVIGVEPHKRIQFSWKEKYFKTSENTICMFILSENKNGTTLQVHHTGWESFKDQQQRANLVNGFTKGWDLVLGKLKNYLEPK